MSISSPESRVKIPFRSTLQKNTSPTLLRQIKNPKNSVKVNPICSKFLHLRSVILCHQNWKNAHDKQTSPNVWGCTQSKSKNNELDPCRTWKSNNTKWSQILFFFLVRGGYQMQIYTQHNMFVFAINYYYGWNENICCTKAFAWPEDGTEGGGEADGLPDPIPFVLSHMKQNSPKMQTSTCHPYSISVAVCDAEREHDRDWWYDKKHTPVSAVFITIC